MAKRKIGIDILDSIPYLLKMPSDKVWIDYDKKADVLYISFRRPQMANDSDMEDNIIYHYRDGEIVGITIIGAKKYKNNIKKIISKN